MANERKLRILIDSSGAKTGGKEVTKEMGKIISSAKIATKTFEDLKNAMKGLMSGGGSKAAASNKALKEQVIALKNINEASTLTSRKLADFVKVVGNVGKGVERDISYMKVLDNELGKNAVSTNLAKNAKERLIKAQEKSIIIGTDEYQGLLKLEQANRDREKSLRNLVKDEAKAVEAAKKQSEALKEQSSIIIPLDAHVKALSDATNTLAKSTVNQQAVLHDTNKELRQSATNIKLKTKLEFDSLKATEQSTAEYLKQAEALYRQQKATKSLIDSMKQRVDAEGKIAPIVIRATKEQEAHNKIIARTASLENTLNTVRDGSYGKMVAAEKALRDEKKAILESLNARTSEQKQLAASTKAREKLENTMYAEQARTEALKSEMGRQSVKIQEQRRLVEELARSKERLNMVNSREYAELVKTRKAIEDKNKQLREMGRDVNVSSLSVSKLSSAFSVLGTTLASVGAYFSVLAIARTADDYTNLTNKLSSVTQGTVNVSSATRELLSVSLEARSSLEGTMDVYSKMTRINETLGKSQQEVKEFTEAVTKSVAMSGATVQGAQGAIMQFAQAMSSNWATAAQELNSILEQTPALAYYMVKGLNDVDNSLNLTTGTLKKFAEEGGLSSELVFKAFQKVLPRIREDFKSTDQTISSSLQGVRDAFTVTLGEMDKTVGASKGVTEFFRDLATSLPDLKNELLAITAGLTALVGGAALGGLIFTLQAIGLAIAGPIAALAALAGGLTYVLLENGKLERSYEASKKTLDDLNYSTERYNATVKAMNSSQVASGMDAINKEILDQTIKLEEASAEVSRITGILKGGSNWDIFVASLQEDLGDNLETSSAEVKVLVDVLGTLGLRLSELSQRRATAISEDTAKSVDRFKSSVLTLTGGLTEQQKASEAHEATLKQLYNEYDAVYKKVMDNNNVSEKESQLAVINTMLTEGRTRALAAYEEQLDKINKKDKTPKKSNYMLAYEDLKPEIDALRKGGDAYEEYSLRKQAASLLGEDENVSRDMVNLRLEAIVALLEERNNLEKEAARILANKEALANQSKSLELLQSQVQAMKLGGKELDNYILKQQAMSALGIESLLGLTPEAQANLNNYIAFLKERIILEEKSAQASKDKARIENSIVSIDALMKEVAALEKGEKALEDFKLQQQAIQLAGGVLIKEDDKARYKQAYDLLVKMNELSKKVVIKDSFKEMFGVSGEDMASTFTNALLTKDWSSFGSMIGSSIGTALNNSITSSLTASGIAGASIWGAIGGSIATTVIGGILAGKKQTGSSTTVSLSGGGISGYDETRYKSFFGSSKTFTSLRDTTTKQIDRSLSSSISTVNNSLAKMGSSLVVSFEDFNYSTTVGSGDFTTAMDNITNAYVEANLAYIEDFQKVNQTALDALQDLSSMMNTVQSSFLIGGNGSIASAAERYIQSQASQLQGSYQDAYRNAILERETLKATLAGKLTEFNKNPYIGSKESSQYDDYLSRQGVLKEGLYAIRGRINELDGVINESLSRLGTSLSEASAKFSDTVISTISSLEGIDSEAAKARLGELASNYETTFYSLAEQAERAASRAAISLSDYADLGVNASMSLREFRDAFDNFVNSPAFSPEGYSRWLLASEAMTSLSKANEALAEATAEGAVNLSDEISKATNDAFSNILDWINKIQGTSADGYVSLQTAQAQFQTQLSLARSGNADALSTITQYADTVLEAAKRSVNTSEQFGNIKSSIISSVSNIPKFADGGYHSGGLRLVGENGPEIEYTGSSNIYNNSQMEKIFDVSELLAEVKEMKAVMRSGLFAVAKNTGKSTELMRRWEGDGLPAERVYA